VTIDVCDAVAPIAAEWDDLVERTGAAPFGRPGWLEAWWRAFAAGELVIVTARRRGRLVGVLPVRQRAGVLASPTNAHSPGFGVVAEDSAAARQLVAALFALRPRRVQLDYVDAADRTLPEVHRAAVAARHGILRTTVQRSPYILLAGAGDLDRRLPGKVARNLRRLHRRLEDIGSVQVELADGRSGLDALLEEGFRIEPSGWKAERGTAIASSALTRRFYTDVAGWAVEAGLLRLAFLRHDGRAIAFALALQDSEAFYLIKGGYDPALRRFAPGKLLARAMVAHAAASGARRFEFLGGEEPWKLEWTSECHERLLVRTFARTPLGTADRAAQAAYLRYGRPLAKRALARMR